MDTEDDLDPIARITNNENIANRSKIIAHLMRLNEAKINKEPIEEVKLTPSMKAKTGGYVQKYVLGSTVSGDPTKPKTALEKRKEKYDANKPKPVNQYSIREYIPDSKAKKIYKTLVAPVSAMDNRPDTSYDDPSGLDVALGVVNPFAWIDGAATVLKSTKDIVTGEGQGNDYTTVGLSAAGAALGLRGSGAKRVGDKISKFMNNMYNPAAGVNLKKADVPTPTNNIETPEGFQNRVFDSNVQLGQYSGKGHLSEAGYNYRVLSPAEIDAIAETRGVFPRVGKQKGGNENTKYWTKGNEKNWYGDKANLETIRVKQDRFTNDKVVLADDVEVFNKQTGKFEPLSAIRPTPKMSKGGFVSQYVLKPSMSLKKGGYIRKMAAGGGVSDPPGKKYTNKAGNTIIVGNDKKFYWKNKDGSFKEADQRIVDSFNQEIKSSNNPTGPANSWRLLKDSTPKTNNGKNGDYKVLEEFNREYQQRWYQGALNRGLKDGTYTQEDADRLLKNAQDKGYILEDTKPLDNRKLDPINSMSTMDILGTPVNRGVMPPAQSVNGSKGGDYLVQKAMDWKQATPTDGYADYVKSRTGQSNETMKTGGAKEVGATEPSKYMPKGGYYIPGENKNRYDKDEQGNWYIQKDDGKTWVPASSLPNSSDAIKRLNEESKMWDGTQSNKSAASSSLVKPKNNNLPTTTNVNSSNSQIEDIAQPLSSYGYGVSSPNYSLQVTDNNSINNFYDERKEIQLFPLKTKTSLENKKEKYDENKPNKVIDNRQQTGYGQQVYADRNTWTKEAQEGELAVASSLVPVGLAANAIGKTIVNMPKIGKVVKFGKNYIDKIGNIISPSGKVLVKIDPNQVQSKATKIVVNGAKSKGWDSFFKKKGGYIRKMVAGGPIYPMLPNPNTGIYAIDETGMAPYYELPSMVPNSMYDISPINPQNPLVPSATNMPPSNTNPSASPTTSTPNTGDTDVLDMYKNKISERKGDAVRDAEESRRGYNALSKRVGMRDLMQLGTGLVGIGLQDRTERRAFKRPLYIDQKYRGLSPQQINQQAEASTGAGVEAIKQMMNGGGDRVTARLAPVLIDRLMSQQGQTRKAYVDQNTSLERAKYAERGTIQQFNIDEEARARNEERDFNNKAISSSAQLINKYISSRSAGDIEGYKTEEGINRDLTDKLYKLDNNELQTDMIGKEYEMYMSDVRQKITDLEAQLLDPKISFDEAARKSVEYHIAKNKEELRLLEERDKKNKIRQNINGN